MLGNVFDVDVHQVILAARGESPAAFDRRCIPAGGVAPPSNTPGILGRRALPAGRIAGLGATRDFHHGLLAEFLDVARQEVPQRREPRMFVQLQPGVAKRAGDVLDVDRVCAGGRLIAERAQGLEVALQGHFVKPAAEFRGLARSAGEGQEVGEKFIDVPLEISTYESRSSDARS